MIGARVTVRRGGKSEAEKPFWISFADLMTALMVLFLIVMAVALLAVTKTVSEREQAEARQKAAISDCLLRVAEAAKARNEGAKVDTIRQVIDFGDRARYETNVYALTGDQKGVLRRFVPELLSLAATGSCKSVLKRIVVEGYTDKTGFYLNNLSLSLMRSRGVLCAMYETSGPDVLTNEQKEAVRDLFLVGGFAFNSAKDTLEESRRVEMRLEFLGVGEERVESSNASAGNFGTCT
jgi:outer membrane protein OmpA-like peptidoglycan-associated protein